MSDDELMEMELPELDIEEQDEYLSVDDDTTEDDVDDETETSEEEQEEEEASEEQEDSNDTDVKDDGESLNEEDQSESDDDDESGNDKGTDVSKSNNTQSSESKNEAEEKKNVEENGAKSVEIDYKAEYEKITAPFKANGKEIKVDSVEDAIALMQMGANYSKKMAGLKPSLKILKMLENNGLLDETKLTHLIDISRKDHSAIAKAVVDAGLDPIDINDSADQYKPGTYTVSDQSLKVDQALSEIRSTPGYATTLDIVSNKWDENSRSVLLTNPEYIVELNKHVDAGIYSKVWDRVEHLRMLGKLPELSDFDAYKAVGDAMYKQQPETKAPVVVERSTVATKQSTNSEVVNRKKAVAPLKTSNKASVNGDFNPLAMSDAEFEKMAAQNKF